MAETETVHWWYGATRSLLRQVLAPHLVEGSSLLDLGCGTGATDLDAATKERVARANADEFYGLTRP